MIAERADAAIKEPQFAPSLLAAIERGGVDGRSPDDWIDAHAGLQWKVWLALRVIRLLETIAMALGVKKP